MMTPVVSLLGFLLFNIVAGGGDHVVADLKNSAAAAQWVAVAPKAILAELEPLAAHRLAKGMTSVALVPVESIWEMPGDGTRPEKLQMFSREIARKGGGRYLLLIGDAETIPPMVSDVPKSPGAVTDTPFVCDDSDAVPDRAIGRVPSADAAIVRDFVERTIQYENITNPAGWRRRISFLAAAGGFDADAVIDSMVSGFLDRDLPLELDLRVLRPDPGSPFGIKPDEEGNAIRDLFNAGSLVSIYAGHGSRHGFHTATGAGFTRSILMEPEIEKLEVRNGSPFVVIFACDTGQFGNVNHYDKKNQEGELVRQGVRVKRVSCAASAFLLNPKGAVCVLAASENSHPYPDFLLAHGMNELFRTTRRARIGDLVLAAKQKLGSTPDEFRSQIDRVTEIFGLKDEERARLRNYELAIYNLFGDPATMLARPEGNITIQAPPSAAVGDEIPVEVKCTVPDGTSVMLTFELSRSAAPRKAGFPAANDRVLRQAAGEFKNGVFQTKLTIPRVRPGRAVFVADVRGDGIQRVDALAVEITAAKSAAAVEGGETAPQQK